ncbi:hypothetical protein NUU61_000024 [Penicillium alfredii]|uniref:Glutathione S-transferase n=1 Tax=Penicillium alfredii TaxID=1506179 RepID=A0A9W9G8S3_9EURO|nr:uncharacterized protein NUU61_000024 [Penicillium alfredii]KAJ5114265.1 hypothetical protein NUU61_000024 [Penicillium alfredii]
MAPFGTIYSYMPNPRVMKAQAVANINGLELAIHPSFTMGKTNRTEEFLSKFPLGKVPVFEGADGTTLFESDAITLYLAESGPVVAQLLGTTLAERAAIRQWICFGQSEVQEPITQLALWRIKLRLYDPAIEESALQRLERSLTCMEAHLNGRTWFVSDSFSLADISLAAALVWGFSMAIDAEMRQRFPLTVSWYDRTLSVEGMRQAFGEKNFVEKRQVPPV